MSTKKKATKQEPVHQAPAVPVPVVPTQQVVLLMDGVNAHRVRCPSGTVIAPNIDGWPAHRVAAHLRDGRAK